MPIFRSDTARTVNYGWIVTRDNVTNMEGLKHLPTRKDWTGPRNASPAVDAALAAGLGVQWRTGPDGVHEDRSLSWSYYGRVVELDEAGNPCPLDRMDGDACASPLDNLGMPDCGDAIIEHKNAEGKWEAVIG